MTGVLFPGSNIAGKYTTLDPGPLTITVLRYFITQLFLSGLLHYKSSAPIPVARHRSGLAVRIVRDRGIPRHGALICTERLDA
jgi:hypothetical protein